MDWTLSGCLADRLEENKIENPKAKVRGDGQRSAGMSWDYDEFWALIPAKAFHPYRAPMLERSARWMSRFRPSAWSICSTATASAPTSC
ncbi:MAG TPA: hypothetical protein VFT19_01745 [Solirubrobacterales bacterium]|nr:hypothetical protein [Solirubrobacterales bacterium]